MGFVVYFICLVPLVSCTPLIEVFLNEDFIENSTEADSFTWPYDDNMNNSSDINPGLSPDVDMWSVVWYLGAFGGLVTFFVVVTCSEWCFGNHMYSRHGTNELYINAFQSTYLESQRVPETPPPPYHLFAPPSYSDLFGGISSKTVSKKNKVNVFIIPVHRTRRNETASAS